MTRTEWFGLIVGFVVLVTGITATGTQMLLGSLSLFTNHTIRHGAPCAT